MFDTADRFIHIDVCTATHALDRLDSENSDLDLLTLKMSTYRLSRRVLAVFGP